MPVIYRCKYCGFPLHVYIRVGQDSYGVPTPTEVMSRYGDHCPRCGRPLEPPSLEDITVTPDLSRALEVIDWAREELGLSFRSIEKHIEWLRLRVEKTRAKTMPTASSVAAGLVTV